VWSWPHTSI